MQFTQTAWLAVDKGLKAVRKVTGGLVESFDGLLGLMNCYSLQIWRR